MSALVSYLTTSCVESSPTAGVGCSYSTISACGISSMGLFGFHLGKGLINARMFLPSITGSRETDSAWENMYIALVLTLHGGLDLFSKHRCHLDEYLLLRYTWPSYGMAGWPIWQVCVRRRHWGHVIWSSLLYCKTQNALEGNVWDQV